MQKRISKAKENESFYNKIKSFPDYTDWKITVIFYTSLHYVDAIAIKLNSIGHKGFNDHAHREKVLSQTLPVWNQYYANKKYSINARYICDNVSHSMQEQIKQLSLNDSIENLKAIKKFAKASGIPL